MAKFTLTKREDQLRSELAGMLEQFHATWPDKPDLARNLLDKMADLALKLHQSLKKRGHEPKHSAQMLRNRRVAPDTKDFYSHVHPIEDLLQIVSNPEAQARSTDTTIGQEFRFQVFSHRWGHEENYKLKRTETGWYVEFMAISGPCDKTGAPYLFENLRHDSIQYPAELGMWLEWLWRQAQDKGLTAQEVQEALDQLSKWVIHVEKERPQGPAWKGVA